MTQALVIEAEVGMLGITPEDRGLAAGQVVTVIGWVADHAGLQAVVIVYDFDAEGNVRGSRFRAVEVGLLEPLP